MAALDRGVSVVVCLCAEAQVRWIHAWRIVASVHDYLASRNFTHEVLIGVAVRSNRLFSWQKKDAVSVFVFGSSPKPARLGFLDAKLKDIFRANNFEVLQSAVFPCTAVTASAKFSAHGFGMAAIYAGKFLMMPFALNPVSLVKNFVIITGLNRFVIKILVLLSAHKYFLMKRLAAHANGIHNKPKRNVLGK